MPKILNFGSLNIDYVYGLDHIIRPGETEPSISRSIFPGGKGLNQSVACAKAGAEVYHAGAVGGDDHRILTDVLTAAGVNLDYLKVHEEVPSGHTIIQVDKNGQNSIILFGGSNQSLKRAEIDETLAHFGKGDYLVLQNEVNELPYLIEQGAARGLNIAFNVSPFKPELLDLPLAKCAMLLVNEVEAAGIADMSPDTEPLKLLEALKTRLPATDIVMTLGTRGSVFRRADGSVSAFGCYKVKAVDTTGSGDTFTGFLLQSLASGLDDHEAVKRASCAAALSVMQPGAASSIPGLETVLASDLYRGPEPAELPV